MSVPRRKICDRCGKRIALEEGCYTIKWAYEDVIRANTILNERYCRECVSQMLAPNLIIKAFDNKLKR